MNTGGQEGKQEGIGALGGVGDEHHQDHQHILPVFEKVYGNERILIFADVNQEQHRRHPAGKEQPPIGHVKVQRHEQRQQGHKENTQKVDFYGILSGVLRQVFEDKGHRYQGQDGHQEQIAPLQIGSEDAAQQDAGELTAGKAGGVKAVVPAADIFIQIPGGRQDQQGRGTGASRHLNCPEHHHRQKRAAKQHPAHGTHGGNHDPCHQQLFDRHEIRQGGVDNVGHAHGQHGHSGN